MISASPDDRSAPIGSWQADVRDGLAYAYLTSLIVFLAVPLGQEMLRPSPYHPAAADMVTAMAHWDGVWYARIIEQGYSFSPAGQSSVAFFPAFPLLARTVAWATGVQSKFALVMTAQFCFAAACIVILAYLRVRSFHSDERLRSCLLLSIGLFPAGLFLRMAYSESLFLLLAAICLLGMARGWPPLAVALVAGLATAARPTGLTLIPPLLWHWWKTSPGAGWRRASAFARRTLLCGPIAGWGIIGYSMYLSAEFGEPVAFASAQYQWRLRPESPLPQRLFDLALLEPLRAVYDANSPGYWGRWSMDQPALLSLTWANPLYFLASAVLLIVGSVRRWLTATEWLLGLGLLLIPYVTRGHEMCMASSGRFACVNLPCLLVAAELLARGGTLAAGVLAIAAVLLGIYAAQFAAGYALI